jgi:inorganic pyrophosphatase
MLIYWWTAVFLASLNISFARRQRIHLSPSCGRGTSTDVRRDDAGFESATALRLSLPIWEILRGGQSGEGVTESGELDADVAHVHPEEVQTRVRGRKGTRYFRRLFIDMEGKEISPWHDLPLYGDVEGTYFMVTEIPKMTRPKMEIVTKEAANPIAQDVDKKGQLRKYHGPIFWNYGYLPRTWEDPSTKHPQLNVYGDNDPVDVVEIGSRQHDQGEVVPVKVLGALAMIDDGELDWKIIAIALDDDLAADLNDIADVEAMMPWVISGIREWFRWYKTPSGKPLNSFGFEEVAVGSREAYDVIDETHAAWKNLRSGAVKTNLWTGTEEARPKSRWRRLFAGRRWTIFSRNGSWFTRRTKKASASTMPSSLGLDTRPRD